jgi:polysaccharide biosynthesis transport protein
VLRVSADVHGKDTIAAASRARSPRARSWWSRLCERAERDEILELRDYVRILHRNWVLILSLTVLGAAVGFGWSLLKTPEYEATTELYVSVRSTDSALVGELAQGTNYARQAVTSFVDVVNSAVVLDRVIDDLDLDVTSSELSRNVSASVPPNTVIRLARISPTSS